MIAKKQFDQTGDEFELCFNLFPTVCETINDRIMTDKEKTEFIKNLTDMQIFTEVSTIIADIQTNIANDFEKKKTNMNTNSANETKPEK